MATLQTDVQDRYPAAFLIRLTNPYGETATTINTTVLDRAVADVQAAFKTICNVNYDSTDDRHVEVAVLGVVAKLRMYMGHDNGEDHERWLARMRELARVTGQNRQLPTTNSTLLPSTRKPNELPDFDRLMFKDYIPGPPARNPNQE